MVEILFAKKTDFDTHEARTDDPHSVTKTQVGLGNVLDVAQVEDAGASPSIQAALAAARPAAGTDGRIFIATDTLEVSRDNGITWDDLVGADLAAVEALSTEGLLSRTGAGAFSTRTLAAPAAGITITNPDGVSGNPTFVLADDLAAVEGLSTLGGVERTGANAWATFALTAFAKTILDDADAGAVRTTLELVIGTDVQADLDVPIQAEAEAGVETAERVWTAERIKQAIAALETDKVAQVVNTQTGAVATGTEIMPFDDTIPQIDEGDEYMSVTITPKNSNNILIIEVIIHLSSSEAGTSEPIAALFQDTTADALACGVGHADIALRPVGISFIHKMIAGTTLATTFTVRGGNTNASTTTFNGADGSRKFGGVLASSITIREYLP